MSLRQLKFKPKLQLNPSVKNKADENSNKSAQKEQFNSNSTSTVHSNTDSNHVNEVSVVEAVSTPKSPVKISERKDIPSTQIEGITFSGSFSSPVNCDGPKVKNISVSNVSAADFTDSLDSGTAKCDTTKPEDNPNDICQDKIKVSESQSYVTKSEEGFELPLSCSDSGDDEAHVVNGNDRTRNHLINYDVLKEISSPCSQQVHSSSNDISKTSSNGSILKDLEINENITASFDSTEKAGESDKTEIANKSAPPAIEFNGFKPPKISRFLHKPKLGLSKTVNTVPCEDPNAESNCEEKSTKRRKNDNKSVSANSNKVATHQRTNFKPNLATIGKIKRPEKFTMSSYSKMESLVKEQFIKKFGKEQEPDTSKLTMMDLIFYNPSSNPMSQGSDKKLLKHLNVSAKTEKVEENISDTSSATESKTDKQKNNNDDAVPVPQLTISADGKVIVAQDSLVIKPSQDLSTSNFETVIDGEFKKKKPVKNPNRCGWSHIDTVNFYKALNSLGCDFETMQTLFPGRSRRNLKSKFKKEEKLRGSLINKVLSHHSEFDLTNVVRELEIDTIYKSTIKNYGRDLSENGKRPGRRKSLSSVVAGKSSGKDEEDTDDDFTDDDEFPKRKRKADPVVISKISNVLGLNDKDDLTATEIKNKLSNSDESDICTTIEPVRKRNRRKWKENVESDNDIDSERQSPSGKKNSEFEDSDNHSTSKNPRILRKKKKLRPGTLPNKSIIIRLEDLIDFNEGVDNEPQPDSKAETINENHIVINTNIEFEHVKYTRYISYNPNNLENPIEINETVAHVD